MSDVIERQEQAARQSWTEIVVDFGIDRFQRILCKYGTLALLGASLFLSYSNPQISCFPQADFKTSKIPSGFKEFTDTYCWETDPESQENSKNDDYHDFDGYDPRILMENLINCLLLQLVILQIPFLMWDGTTGGVILGHIKYLKNLIEDVAEAFKRLDMVHQHDDVYDESGEIIRPVIGSCLGAPKNRKKDDAETCGKFENSENSERENFTDSGDSPTKAELNDLTFMNLLLFQNIASMEYFPYVRSIIKIFKRSNFEPSEAEKGRFADPGKAGGAAPKHHQLEHLMGMWWNRRNLTSSYYKWQYIFKHVLQFSLATASVFIMVFKGNFKFILELESNKFVCNLPEYDNMKAACFILGHKELAMLATVNFVILVTVNLCSISAVFMLCHYRLNHQAANLTQFLQPVKYTQKEGFVGRGTKLEIFKEILLHEKEKAADNPEVLRVELVDGLRKRSVKSKDVKYGQKSSQKSSQKSDFVAANEPILMDPKQLGNELNDVDYGDF